MLRPFRDRAEAGQLLARKLLSYAGGEEVIVLGLPRGGIPVAYEVARRLGVPLDVFVVRKLGVPGHEELAMGAIASGGVRVLNEDVLAVLPNASAIIETVTALEREELERRERNYRGGRAAPHLEGRTIILVDDGLATGASMRAAVRALRQRNVGRVVVAVPVGAASTCQELAGEVEEIICPLASDSFIGVGQYYVDFSQTTDEQVRDFLERSAAGES